jgi:hypothetical protein
VLQHGADGGSILVLDGIREWRASEAVAAVGVCVVPAEQAHQVDVAVLGREHQGGVADRVRRVRRHTCVQQRGRSGRIAGDGGLTQLAAFLVVLLLWQGATPHRWIYLAHGLEP